MFDGSRAVEKTARLCHFCKSPYYYTMICSHLIYFFIVKLRLHQNEKLRQAYL